MENKSILTLILKNSCISKFENVYLSELPCMLYFCLHLQLITQGIDQLDWIIGLNKVHADWNSLPVKSWAI